MSGLILIARRGRWLEVLLLRAALSIALAAGPLGSVRADEDDAKGAVAAPSRVTVRNGVTTITLDAAAQQNGGIVTARPAAAPAEDRLPAYASILDAGALTDLSNRYLDARTQLQAAEAKLAVSRAALDRARKLYKDEQNVSAAQLESAEGAFEVDRAALAAAQARLTTLAATAQQSWGAVLGKALADASPLITGLIERRDYLVKVTLPPGMILTDPPKSASATLSDGVAVELRLVSPATAADPRIQGASYFYVVPAASNIMPGLAAMASLPTGEKPKGVVVPASAVVWLQGKAWIFVRTNPETFVRRPVATARGLPDGGYLVSDLAADSDIVVRGAQMLLSEEFRGQVRSEEDER